MVDCFSALTIIARRCVSGSKEQASAKGNFPGPCPVVYYPPLSTADATKIEAAAEAGAQAVVLRSDALQLADIVLASNMEVIWDVRSAEEITDVVGADKGLNFLLPGAEAYEAGLMSELPKDAVAVASVDAQNDEIVMGRELAKKGCKAVIVRQACLGVSSWDLTYAKVRALARASLPCVRTHIRSCAAAMRIASY